VSNISDSGQWDSVNLKIKWGPFFDATVRVLKYNATPPAGQTGVKFFDGMASFDGNNVGITGDLSIQALAGLWHPADANHDFLMKIGEITGYGAAWKSGGTWAEGPVPIPIAYITRAGYLWKNGEAYHYVPTADPAVWPTNATVWVTGAAPAPMK
jgi:hypothetical protein